MAKRVVLAAEAADTLTTFGRWAKEAACGDVAILERQPLELANGPHDSRAASLLWRMGVAELFHVRTLSGEWIVVLRRTQHPFDAKVFRRLWQDIVLIPGLTKHSPPGECPVCGAHIAPSRVRRGARYCSTECRLRAKLERKLRASAET